MSDDQKYYFLTEGSGKKKFPRSSYLIEQIIRSSRLAIPEAFLEQSGMEDQRTYLFDPSGNQMKLYHFSIGTDEKTKLRKEEKNFSDLDKEEQKVLVESVKSKIEADAIKQIKKKCIVDRSRVAGETICSLTQEEFKEPCWLNLNGRTYERQAIIEAIEKSLYLDENLRLEDITLTSEMVDQIVLTPNAGFKNIYRYGLSGSEYRPDPEKVDQTPFDFGKIAKNNIPNFSAQMKEILDRAGDENGMWRIGNFWTAYAEHRDLNPEWPNRTAHIRDLELHGINLTRWHPKCNSGHIVFRNIHFIDSLLWVNGCWCGCSFKDCRFTDCQLVSTTGGAGSGHQLKIDRCTQVNCTDVEVESEKDIPWISID